LPLPGSKFVLSILARSPAQKTGVLGPILDNFGRFGAGKVLFSVEGVCFWGVFGMGFGVRITLSLVRSGGKTQEKVSCRAKRGDFWRETAEKTLKNAQNGVKMACLMA